MLKDEVHLQNENEIEIIKLNSFQPRFKWSKCDISDIGQFELFDNRKSRIYKIDPSQGMMLKEFLSGKVCFQGINNHFKIAKIISNGNFGSIVRMRNLQNEELVTCKIFKQGRPELEQEFTNEVLALQFLKHKNLPKIREYYIEANHNYIIYDLFEGHPLDICIKNNVLDNQQMYNIMKELLRVVKFIKMEGYSHQNIKLENIYYYSLMNQITLVDFGKSQLKNQSVIAGDSYFSKTTKDYSELNTQTYRNANQDKDYFDCGLVFLQLITQKVLSHKDIHYSDNNHILMSLITEIHNQKISTFLMKLLSQNKVQDKSSFSENLLTEIDDLNFELSNYKNY
ncbi:unnamed protein product (macronuclear) [Paramecium tetraurelia]|uniref:Protein kinase domain-containing protein n=1 Tax=Paramecium tetraurelia TaxID=5888 RepID=A0DSC7_PARTE|nr:uncharacterized protein GSPATT00019648001 [Paramecium tetraurelia]CAK85944.1 unnamed protein product [Paramecium tetraurelia]|eukprot:XP_001453341.1 hypothetical protein (macronuclear) [Paramecium tetraurelia strain d4-2]